MKSLTRSSIMSPNTRQRKSRLSKELIQIVENWKLNTEDNVEVLTLSLKKMDLLNAIKGVSAEQRGRKMTPFATRSAVWKY